jgi:murein DD-endopeptidase
MPDQRKEFIRYAEAWIGSWYKWGGDDPSGFDCSGFVIECLKAWGKFPRKQDTTANGLLQKFTAFQIITPYPASLVFWCDPTSKAYHVEICVTNWQSIGASGGGSKTLTIEDAIRDNAFIKIRPIYTRPASGEIIILDPFMGV